MFVKSLVYGLEGLHTEEVSGSMRRWRRLFLVKFACQVQSMLPGEPPGRSTVSCLPDAHKPSPWSVLVGSGAHFGAGKVTDK